MMPKRIQRKRTKGSKLPAKTLCASRPSIWGNTYSVKEFGDLALPLYRNTLLGIWNPALLDGQPEALITRAYELHSAWQRQFRYRHPLDTLRETLKEYDFVACWCPLTSECHVDTMLELANA